MLNTIKMDLYRMIKSKALLVTIIIAAFSVFLNVATAKFQLSNPEFQKLMQEAMEESGDVNVGIQAGNVGLITETTPTENIFASSFVGGTFLLMGAIFIIIFVCKEHNEGFIKNVVSRKGYRRQMSASKAIITVAYTLIQFVACSIIFLIVYGVLFQGFQFKSVVNLLRYTAVQALIQIVIMNLCVLFSNLVRNMAISITFGVLLSSGLFSLVTVLIDHLELPFRTTDYLLTIIMNQLPVVYDSSIYQRALAVSLIGVVVYQSASLLVMKKQDVR